MPPYVERPYGRCLHAAVPKATFCYAMSVTDKEENGAMKNGLDRHLLHVCGFIPKQYLAKGPVVSRLWTWILYKE